MEDCCVHYVEFGVRNGDENVRRFTQHYKFELAATRKTEQLKQWVLTSGIATVLLTQQELSVVDAVQDKYSVGWSPGGQNEGSNTSTCAIDSVYNVALKVRDLTKCVDKLSRSGVTILKAITKVADSHGSVRMAMVRSCLGNVVHTLIDDSDYKGVFLPEFEIEDKYIPGGSELVTHFDHVTFACDCGDSGRIIDWYANNFGMRRFLINK